MHRRIILFLLLFASGCIAAEESKPVAVADAVSALPFNSEKRKPHVPPAPGEALELTVKELGNFNYDVDRGGNIPDDVKKLSGSLVRVRGFMIPLDQRENITQFSLVPSLLSCCFGKPPQVHHSIIASAPKGKAVNYFADEITVEGMLHVEEKKDEGYIVSVFTIDVSSVRPAPKK